MISSRIFRYFITAGAASIVDVVGFALLCRLPISVGSAAAGSFCVAAVVNYVLSSRHAFDSRPTLRGFGLFLLGATGGLLVNVSVTLIGVEVLGLLPILAKIAGVGTAFLLNYWINLHLVFRRADTG